MTAVVVLIHMNNDLLCHGQVTWDSEPLEPRPSHPASGDEFGGSMAMGPMGGTLPASWWFFFSWENDPIFFDG